MLGYATNKELMDELHCRFQLGHVDRDYSTVFEETTIREVISEATGEPLATLKEIIEAIDQAETEAAMKYFRRLKPNDAKSYETMRGVIRNLFSAESSNQNKEEELDDDF